MTLTISGAEVVEVGRGMNRDHIVWLRLGEDGEGRTVRFAAEADEAMCKRAGALLYRLVAVRIEVGALVAIEAL